MIITLIVVLTLFGNSALLTQDYQGYPRLMQGPMVGAVTDSSARIWVRASGEFPVKIIYHSKDDTVRQATSGLAKKANDYILVLELTGLQSETEHFYSVFVNEKRDEYLRNIQPFRLKTAPKTGDANAFSIAFGSCARFQSDRLQPIWQAIAARQPDLFFWIGDNVYGDASDPDILREEYRRQRDVAALQPVLRNISQLGIWDDHDYGIDDQDSNFPLKTEMLSVFKDYWANPAYGLPETPGVFFRHPYGAVDFFFLDVRYHRSANKSSENKNKSMLGSAQLRWLKNGLAASNAAFKVIISGSGWNKGKGPDGDAWSAFLSERDAVFDFIRDEGIDGVVLLSGDSHVGELNVIPWSEKGGYDFYELASSPLAQSVVESWLERRPERRIRPVYFKGPNFGLVRFEFDGRPKLIYQLYAEDGRRAFKPLTLFADELVNGVESWPAKVTPREKRRHENHQQGKGYYDK